MAGEEVLGQTRYSWTYLQNKAGTWAKCCSNRSEEGRGVELISHPASGGDQSTSLWARDTHW